LQRVVRARRRNGELEQLGLARWNLAIGYRLLAQHDKAGEAFQEAAAVYQALRSEAKAAECMASAEAEFLAAFNGT
jgi:hypothetical protein